MKKHLLLLSLAVAANLAQAAPSAAHAIMTCLPEQRQDGAGAEEFNRIFPKLMDQAIAKVQKGVVLEAYFLDENYRNGAAFIIGGKNANDARAHAEQFRSETEAVLNSARLPFKARCTVGGKMVLPAR